MQTRYDGHGKVRKVLLSANEIVERGKSELPLTRQQRRRILFAYFRIAVDTVLAGFSWKFPDGSTFSIQRERKGVSVSRNLRDEHGFPKRVHNINRINERYGIRIDGGAIDEKHYRLESAAPLRKELTKILLTTNQQYRFRS